jgi:hypothetical protein
MAAFHHNEEVHRRLRRGSRGNDVKKLQKGINERLEHVKKYWDVLGIDGYLKRDGVLGRETVIAFRRVAPLVGLPHFLLTKNAQLVVRNPARRTDRQKRRSQAAHANLHKKWKAQQPSNSVAKQLGWLRSHLGAKEQPSGSNGGPGISTWQAIWGFGRVPWCGIYVAMGCRAAGLKVTSRLASVALVEEDAKRGANGLRRWKGPREGQPGDAVVLFGYGVHVETIEKKTSWGYITLGGNTSGEGMSGSQSNGGMSARRNRTFATVRGCAEFRR